MPRFRDRSLRLLDIPDRFEAQPSSVHAYNALGAIGRLRDDGDRFWGDGSSQNTRWKEYCMILYRFINRLGERRYIEKQPLETAFREFIQEFEHSISGMYEMLYGTASDPEDSEHIQQIIDWFNLVYRLSTYALVSYWIDDKTEEHIGKITVDMRAGEISEHWTRKEMRVPRKYRRTTKNLL